MNEKRVILVIEDERTISNFICRALNANDYKSIPAFSGKEGLSLFFSHSPDLVLLDIKALQPELCRAVCGSDGRNALRLLDELERRGIDVWIRHVVVPGLTDDDRLLDDLVGYLKPYRCVRKIEWLPYHTMGVPKYKKLGIAYPLEGVQPPAKERVENAKRILRAGWQREEI